MTALFPNSNHASESNLSHPFRRNTNVREDGSDADLSEANRTYEAEDASSILFPTLRRLPTSKPSPEIYTSSPREKNPEGEPLELRSKSLQAEMSVGKVNEFDATSERLDRHVPPDSAKKGAVENGTTKTRTKKGKRNSPPTASNGDPTCERVLKLSPSPLVELASTSNSLSRGPPSPTSSPSSGYGSIHATRNRKSPVRSSLGAQMRTNAVLEDSSTESRSRKGVFMPSRDIDSAEQSSLSSTTKFFDHTSKPTTMPLAVSTPVSIGPSADIKATETSFSHVSSPPPQLSDRLDVDSPPLHSVEGGIDMKSPMEESCPSPIPTSIPLPPFSLPTYLQLELSSNQPSALYIHRSKASEIPYEPSMVKVERLLNFLLLPPQLEQVLLFGTLACLDAFLFSFTILPLRFFKALSILIQSWGFNVAREAKYVSAFIYAGAGRMWKRKRRDSTNRDNGGSLKNDDLHRLNAGSVPTAAQFPASVVGKTRGTDDSHPESNPVRGNTSRGARPKPQSTPSTLLPAQKADLLKGVLLILSCTILMYLDASRMYHGIRGQAAIKLYVIYNVLEVCDRLFAALGQDVLECLFAKETLERHPNGRSQIWRPLWLFVLALIYNLVHATSLFYQVITLNVAVNSYSNALLTLLMSNQFVEIKSTVFKKIEKENLFQLTCADVVERFQLWLMLTIIAFRNIIETGGLSLSLGGSSKAGAGPESPLSPLFQSSSSILPKSFTVLPEWTGQVMGPFLLVLGSEMLVDWIKHAYITKFNNTKPAIYGRFLDILAKDYYSDAFGDRNLVRRLGLPIIPLASLFIRASVQTYHMFIATNVPLPLPSAAASLSVDSAISFPAGTAAIQHFDHLFRQALSRSTFGAGFLSSDSPYRLQWSVDDGIAFATMLVYFLVLFLVLLTCKLLLGMFLLSYARHRYRGMKERERISVHADGRRVGGLGVVEVDDDKRRWIYRDDPAGLKQMKEREGRERLKAKAAAKAAAKDKDEAGSDGLEGVIRYSMVAKRIW